MTPEYLSRILSQTPRFFQTPRILSGILLKFWNFEALYVCASPLKKWFSLCNFWKTVACRLQLVRRISVYDHDHFGGSFWTKHNHLVVTKVCHYPQKMHYHPVQQEQHSIWSPQWWGGGSEVWIYLIGGSNHVAHLQPIIFRLSSSPSTRVDRDL